jgi:hypothetical protein
MAPCVSRGLKLGALAVVALSGCGARAPSPAGAALDGSSEGRTEDADPSAIRAKSERDAASARALGPLPHRLERFTLDPYAEVRAFGTDRAAPLERACEQILEPGCAEGRGLDQVIAARYVDGEGSRATLDVTVSRYLDADGAYAAFTDGLIGERDPLELTARPLDVPGLGVLDGERVASWLGRYVVSVSYGDETEPAERRAAAATARLPEATRRLLAALPAHPDLPLSVQRLPRAHRIPLGARLVPGDALGIPGMGMGAVGYYRDADKRWRVLAIVRPDDEAAKDVLSTLGRNPAARSIRNAPLDALSFTERRLPAEPYVGWVVGQRHEVIYGVGDEATALPEFTSAEREAAVKLSLLDKLVKLTKVHLE